MRKITASNTFIFFNDPATTEIYTLSLHDALPISPDSASIATGSRPRASSTVATASAMTRGCIIRSASAGDRKSTRLNSSHANISYAVFCLKKKKYAEKASVLEDIFVQVTRGATQR